MFGNRATYGGGVSVTATQSRTATLRMEASGSSLAFNEAVGGAGLYLEGTGVIADVASSGYDAGGGVHYGAVHGN